jgi:hypothetical protein
MARETLLQGQFQATQGPAAVRTAYGRADRNFVEVYGSLSVQQKIELHASKTVHTVFVAPRAMRVTGIQYTPDIAQGAALTACVCKATGTATPTTGTTPAQSSVTGINLNGTAHTVQTIALSATAANLTLAAGDRLALVLSGALTTGSGLLSITVEPA